MKPVLRMLALLLPATVMAQPAVEMIGYVDLSTGLRLSHPKDCSWLASTMC